MGSQRSGPAGEFSQKRVLGSDDASQKARQQAPERGLFPSFSMHRARVMRRTTIMMESTQCGGELAAKVCMRIRLNGLKKEVCRALRSRLGVHANHSAAPSGINPFETAGNDSLDNSPDGGWRQRNQVGGAVHEAHMPPATSDQCSTALPSKCPPHSGFVDLTHRVPEHVSHVSPNQKRSLPHGKGGFRHQYPSSRAPPV